jgi:hypothetical protein
VTGRATSLIVAFDPSHREFDQAHGVVRPVSSQVPPASSQRSIFIAAFDRPHRGAIDVIAAFDRRHRSVARLMSGLQRTVARTRRRRRAASVAS